MRVPDPKHVAALKRTCGAECDLRWNEAVGRFEFLLPGGDGVVRSQFWGQFWRWDHGNRVRLDPDPTTGLHPFRDLDDFAMREALDNLTKTFVGNPYDGAGSTQQEVANRIQHNAKVQRDAYQQAGEAFGYMAGERKRRLAGNPQVSILTNLSTEE